MELNKKNVKMLIFVIAMGILIFLGLQNMNLVFGFLGWILSVFTPMLIGLAFAFIFNVPLKFFERKVFTRKDGTSRLGKATRPISLLLSVLLVLAIIAAILLLIIPELLNSIITLVQNLPDTFINLQNWIEQLSEDHPQFKEFFMSTNINWNEIFNSFIGTIQDISINFVSQALNILVGTVSFVVNIFLGLIFSIYFLLKKEQLYAQFKKLTYAFIPEKKADMVVSIFKLTGETFSRSVAGSMIECTILGTITVTAMLIFGFPYAMMIGVIVAVMALIPMFGVTIGIIIGAFLILTVNPTQAVWFVVMMIIIQQINYTVFESVNMKSTHYAERIFDAVATEDIENGTFGYLDGLDDGEDVIYKFVKGSATGKQVVVVDQPVWNSDECKITNQRKDN